MAAALLVTLACLAFPVSGTHQQLALPSEVRSGSLLQAINEIATEIQLEFKQKDRLKDVEKLLTVNSKLDDLNKKIAERASPQGETENVFSWSDFDTKVATLGEAMTSLQVNFATLKDRLAKLEEREQRSTQDINTKIRKMTSVISSVYEMNRDLQSQVDLPGLVERGRSGGHRRGLSSEKIAIIMESLQEIERKFKEEVSVVKAEVKNDLNYVRNVATNIIAQCSATEPIAQEDDIMTGDYDDLLRSRPRMRSRQPTPGPNLQSILGNVTETLKRSQRQIKEEMSVGLNDLDARVASLAFQANRCRNPAPVPSQHELVAESQIVTAVRAQDPYERQGVRPPSCTPVSGLQMPNNCAELLGAGELCQGTYLVSLDGRKQERLYCDMLTAGGGWTVIMRKRHQGRLNFTQPWQQYKLGFGDPDDEFWLGNEKLHLLSQHDPMELRVELESMDGERLALGYSLFSVGGEDGRYRLRLGRALPGVDPRLTAGLRHHSSHPFSTYDQDSRRGQCSQSEAGGWWHVCRNNNIQLTEPSMLWKSWKNLQPLRYVEMKVRPQNIRNSMY